MKTIAKLLLLLVVLSAGLYAYMNRPPLGQVLVFSKTAGFRHDSIGAGISALTEIAGEHHFAVVATEDPEQFNEENLADFDAVVFLNTTGIVLDRSQQDVLQRFIQAGGGFVGIHSAADTHWAENDWPWYTRLLGAAFLSHPSDPSNVQAATLSVEEAGHSSTRMFDPTFSFTDEWYDYQRVSRHVNVLLSIDESSYQGGTMGEQHPVAWYQNFDGGRSFYTGFGHTKESFEDLRVREHLWAGLEFAIGEGELDYATAAPESWRLKRVVLDAGLDEPMAMDFTPNGDIYYIQRKGGLMRYDREAEASLEVTRFDVLTTGEYGLIGMAFDPEFAANRWLYVFRNLAAGEGAVYRLARFQMIDGQVDHASEQVILEIPSESGQINHTGGTLAFGPQGNLWISTGDTTYPHGSDGFSPHDDRPEHPLSDAGRTSGNTMDLRGKILRIRVEADGSYTMPTGNLFPGGEGGREEIYVMGLRNPFRFDVDQRTGTLYWGEVGPDSREYSETRGPWGYDEFNRTDTAGNFGWPFVIGQNEPYAYYDFENELPGEFVRPNAPENRSANNTGARVLPPARPAWIAYPYVISEEFIELGAGGRSAMAGPVYYHDDFPENPTKLPRYYDGKLFIYDWVRHWVLAVQMDGDGDGDIVKIEPVLDEKQFSAPIHLKFAPDGTLYLLEYGTIWFSQNDDAFLSRVEFYGDDNPPPLATVSADQRVGAAPLTTKLRGSESFDPNGDFESLRFSWDLIEGTRVVRHIADTPDVDFTASEAGDYKLRLIVTDADGASSEGGVVLEVGNAVPEIELAFSNGNSSFYREGASVDYQVVVTDAEDGSTAEGGIDPAAVTVSLQYVPEGEDVANATLGHQQPKPSGGLAEIGRSDCLSCHTRDQASVGPSFDAVAERYAETSGAITQLAQRIQQGGVGNWGDRTMPPHPQLSDAQAETMAAWIIDPRTPSPSQARSPGLPLRGTLDFAGHPGDVVEADLLGRFNTGRYLLMASYVDRGAPGAHAQRANVSWMWLPPRLGPDVAADLNSVMLQPVPLDNTGGLPLAIFVDEGSESDRPWLMLEGVDLVGISTIRVGLSTTRMVTSGGVISLRTGAQDGPLVASHVVENAGLGLPEQQAYFDFDVADLDGHQDLYLIVDAPTEKDTKTAPFFLGSLEFLP